MDAEHAVYESYDETNDETETPDQLPRSPFLGPDHGTYWGLGVILASEAEDKSFESSSCHEDLTLSLPSPNLTQHIL